MTEGRLPGRGSSPLTRGKPVAAWRACAACAAHPRSHGENRSLRFRGRHWSGSSPLTRGKQGCAGVGVIRPRLIPAHAGKTSMRLTVRSAQAAHPRSRGENAPSLMSTAPTAGSSPLTRGKLPGTRYRRRRGRLIPAHAGKTRSKERPKCARTAHPRSRGENESAEAVACGGVGSSPLTRGKLTGRYDNALQHGLIPAHAGKTSTTATSCPAEWAHPRSRGENVLLVSRPVRPGGSSPLTRGKLSCQRRWV